MKDINQYSLTVWEGLDIIFSVINFQTQKRSINMKTPAKTDFISELRRIFWPIEWHENKKFIPMAMMMFCILFTYTSVRIMKDSLIVTGVGAEAISFIKTYLVVPSAVIMMIVYVKLCNIMSQQKVFYTISTFFSLYLAFFAFALYPYQEFFHTHPEAIENLSLQYPNFRWFIRIYGKWSFASFYVIAELYGSMMLTLLFWQFANQITKTSEAKRFYSMFGLLGNLALPLIAVVFHYVLRSDIIKSILTEETNRYMLLLSIIIFINIMGAFFYSWMNKHVLTDPRFYDSGESSGKAKKKKPKLSLTESFKMIFTSKYLGLIVALIICYGVSMNLLEGVWKAKIKVLYPNHGDYDVFMSSFYGYQGGVAILFMLIGSNILRRVSWTTAAIFTPIMILLTGIGFFSFIIFDQSIGLYLAAFFGTGPLALAVLIGAAQGILSKATKYSLFDSTKEMSYIPLDDEMKSKGKAAVDVIGGRFGKAGGAIIQSTFFMLFTSYSFTDGKDPSPYFASLFFIAVILWVFAVRALGKEYGAKIIEHEAEAK